MRNIKSIEQAMAEFNSYRNHDKAVRVGGSPYVPSIGAHELYDILLKQEGKIFLELGCGTGKMTMVAAAAGFDAYGIEINPELARIGRKVADRMRQLLEYRVVCGSYYPDDFAANVKNQGDKVTIVEPAKDTYRNIGLKIEDIDVFYGYFWVKQAKHAWQIFSRYAKKDAVLIQYGLRPINIGLQFLEGLGLTAKAADNLEFSIVRKI